MADSKTTKQYPSITRGASLLLAWRLQGKKVLLIGGGAVAASRLGFLLEAGAHVTLVSPAPLEVSIAHRVATESPEHLTWVERAYGDPLAFADDADDPSDLSPHDEAARAADPEYPVKDFDMVLTAIDDVALSRAVCAAARSARTPVNVADVPPECDFYFGAQVRRGPLQVMVSTSGAGPKVAVIVRDTVAAAIPDDVEAAIAGVGALRTELRARAPGVGGELSKRRMRWMIDTCDAWRLDQMGAMQDEEVRRKLLDDGWDKRKVLGPRDVGAAPGGVKAWASDVARSTPSWLPTAAAFIAGVAVGAAWLDRARR